MGVQEPFDWMITIIPLSELLPLLSLKYLAILQNSNCAGYFGRRIVIKLLVTYFQRNHSKEVKAS